MKENKNCFKCVRLCGASQPNMATKVSYIDKLRGSVAFRGYVLGSGVQCVDVRQNLIVTSPAVKVGALACVTLAV